MHALHRTMYMGERLTYYSRRQEALLYPETVWSLIGDGMAQHHCQLPYLAGLKELDKLTQHLQGVLCHGKLMRVYRTFHNINNGSNLGIHTFLLTLEYLMHRNGGTLPDTVYYQIDGGSENSAKVMFGLAELFIAKRLLKQLVLTRLPVGHTHENIDAKFAKIWVRVRQQHVATMSAYKKLIEEALSGNDCQPIEVVDIFAIPDYFSYLKPCIDIKFGRYCKTKWTQLQWKFEQHAICDDFPLGVKSSYRAYCADRVKEITTDHEKRFGFKCQDVSVKWFPEATESEPAGMYLLQRLPTGILKAESFVEGSRKELERVVSRIQSHYAPTKHGVGALPDVGNMCHGDPIVAEWFDFAANIAPLTDDVDEYCQHEPLYIPFLQELFSDNAQEVAAKKNPKRIATDLPEVEALDSVMWSRRKIIRSKKNPATYSARAIIRCNTNTEMRQHNNPSDSDAESDSDNFEYRLLNQREKRQNKKFYDYVGMHFTDMEEDGSSYEGTVSDVFMEDVGKSICFEFVLAGDDTDCDPQYIVADYAIEECVWRVDEHTRHCDSSNEKLSTAPLKGWTGYAMLDPSVQATTPLFERDDVVLEHRTRQKLAKK
jgi:hypothetical protein